MKLKEIRRTSTFAWSPTTSLPLLATGTVAGALDESFSNESQLEIWAPDFLDKDEFVLGSEGGHGPKGVVTDNSRFNRLAWGYGDSGKPKGVLAAGMENGELVLWDPAKVLAGASAAESLIFRNDTHTGPIRGLDFNPIQPSLLSSGGVNGEVYVWDLKDPGHPYSPIPGTRSTKLDEITAVAWNAQVQHVLAGASTTGYTVVWDLRGKREVVALAYGGGTGTLAGQHVGSMNGLAVGGRRGMSDIAWHPDNATRLVTASEDDSSPIIMVWDLRNARAPEKILTGHEKGVLSLSWCKQDADLLLSCGKDNRALCWNPQTSEIVGELPSASNWAFQVEWCPRNPDLLATAFFDGTVGIHSIQSTNDNTPAQPSAAAISNEGAGLFDGPNYPSTSFQSSGTFSLKQPPKWLRRPVSGSFGFGGKLVTVSNLPSAQGKTQSSVVHLRNVVTEPALVDRATRLQQAVAEDKMSELAEELSASLKDGAAEGWKALLSLFRANSREELVTLLGFSKTEIAVKVAEAIDSLKAAAANETSTVTTGEPERSDSPSAGSDEGDATEVTEGEGEKTPSEVSVSVTSDVSGTTYPADTESTTTVPSLFGDDDPGTPQMDAGADFFSTLGISQQDGGSGQVLIPHTSYGLDSSVAATIGSGPSSVTSETMKNNTFKIYPKEESETDRLVTKALILGDFESAVSLCLSSERFADAILLAVKGGPELLQRTQKAYFERRTKMLPYLRLFQSIVGNDLSDIVQNADLQEWQEIFVVLCTFASQDEFAGLAEQLGRRLEFQFSVSTSSDDVATASKAQEYRKHATLAYLAAGRLERLVNIWIDELSEEERLLVNEEAGLSGSRYTAHAQAVQSFIEKVTVFRAAIKYVDDDLALQAAGEGDSGAKVFKLSGLYERYVEYAEVLAAQGMVKEAAVFLKLTPSKYHSSVAGVAIDHIGSASSGSATAAPTATSQQSLGRTTHAYPPYNTIPSQQPAPVQPIRHQPSPYNSYAPTHNQGVPPLAGPAPPVASQYATSTNTYNSYAPHRPAEASTTIQSVSQQPQPSPYSPYAPASTTVSNPVAQGHQSGQGHTQSQFAPTSAPYNTYAPNNTLSTPPHLRNQTQPTPIASMGPPPSRLNGALPPPPPKRDNGGWNDAPIAPPVRTSSAANNAKPAPITSPFPNSIPSSPGYSPMIPGQNLPPPPRPMSVQARGQTPPQAMRGPPTGVYPPPPMGRPPPQGPPGPSQMPPPGPPHGHNQLPPPPQRMMSPPQGQGNFQRQPSLNQYGPPPPRAGIPGQSPPQGPPQGQFSRPPPMNNNMQRQR
ncbi:hypothetical protein BDN71DRAFT_1453478 [Pleurotus eryngii]|uniref:Protein transport protein SEC31 n=1 Tax=Pleurotus eryngii TaxID=5323 RepID=A0A9P6D4R9_PLEER|nr:hypothetical protein BDN71DRAFT_1453478 [Pleurotus eryngii]